MSDPFPPMERRVGVTRRVLETLADNDYPTVISTKSVEVASDDCLDVLSRGTFMVQLSVSSLDDSLMYAIDLGAPSPSERIAAVRRLSEAGIPVTCRIQPILPSKESDAVEVVAAVADAGAKHVGAEHLKLPIESSWRGNDILASALGREALRRYREHGRRIGREWVLPPEMRIDTMLAIREQAHGLGMTFGAADNDLLPISDGNCCCSGADFVDGFQGFFRFNYAEAVRRADQEGLTSFHSIGEAWYPAMTMARFMNSRSRIVREDGSGGGVKEYLARNWNGRANGASPQMFIGVAATDEVVDGFRQYRLGDELRQLMSERVLARSL
jgi:hypothetical protein